MGKKLFMESSLQTRTMFTTIKKYLKEWQKEIVIGILVANEDYVRDNKKISEGMGERNCFWNPRCKRGLCAEYVVCELQTKKLVKFIS